MVIDMYDERRRRGKAKKTIVRWRSEEGAIRRPNFIGRADFPLYGPLSDPQRIEYRDNAGRFALVLRSYIYKFTWNTIGSEDPAMYFRVGPALNFRFRDTRA